MFTSVTAFSTGHLSYINAPYIILPPNAKSIENYGIAHSKVTYLIITYTAGTFAFNGSWNNLSTISYIYVPDTKVSAYSGRTVYPIIGQESIIEKDREFTLIAPETRYGWHNDLHWTIEENDYISIVSQEDGVATFRATGILPDTNTTVTLSYQSNHGNGFFKGTKVLTVKPTPVIEFEDAEVKRICVSNWGGPLCVSTKVPGVPGELTYEQAAAVTSIGRVFNNNTKITSFMEFQYFTSLINNSLYAASVQNIPFYNCRNLKKIKVPEGITYICGLFRNCASLVFIELPSTLTGTDTIRYYTFGGNPSTPANKKLVVHFSHPFALTASGAYGTYCGTFNRGIYVPDEHIDEFRAADVWKDNNIYPLSEWDGTT